MTGFFLPWALVFIGFCLLAYFVQEYLEASDVVTCLVASAIIVGFVYWIGFSDDAKELAAQNEAQKRADATPHVIREVDGCKVYAWKGGDYWHYFTRCGDGTVTTERNWTERNGKQTVAKHETIVTEGNN